MDQQPPASRSYQFGVYRFDTLLGRLESPRASVVLRQKVADLLAALLEAAPGPLSKRELIEMVWPDTHIAASGVARVMNELRAALGEELQAIETLPKRGYRVTLDVIREPHCLRPDPRPTLEQPTPEQPASLQPASLQPAPEVIPTRRKFRLAGILIPVASLILIPIALGWLHLRTEFAPFPEHPPFDAEERELIARREFQAGYRAWGLWSPAQMDVALEHFRRAGIVDPDLWFGFVGMAEAHLGQVLLSPDADPSALTWARQAAQRAVQLGPQVAVAHCAVGSVALIADWNWQQAEIAFEHALSLNAFSYVAYQRRGLLRMLQGRFTEARADLQRSLELQPEYSDAVVFLAYTEYCARDYERVLNLLEQLPDNPGKRREAVRIKAACYAMENRFPEARRALAGTAMFEPDRLAAQAWIEARRGNTDAASRMLIQLKAQCSERNLAWCNTVAVEAALGRRDDAFESLEAGLRVRHWKLLLLAVDPSLSPLHEDPRWEPFVRRIRTSQNVSTAPLLESRSARAQ
jgi:DNA-binding winged helix-turn-helix (wHTH) protein